MILHWQGQFLVARQEEGNHKRIQSMSWRTSECKKATKFLKFLGNGRCARGI